MNMNEGNTKGVGFRSSRRHPTLPTLIMDYMDYDIILHSIGIRTVDSSRIKFWSSGGTAISVISVISARDARTIKGDGDARRRSRRRRVHRAISCARCGAAGTPMPAAAAPTTVVPARSAGGARLHLPPAAPVPVPVPCTRTDIQHLLDSISCQISHVLDAGAAH